MIQVDEKVLVLQEKEIIGFAFVQAVCQSKEELKQYFSDGHPKLPSYHLAVCNKEPVYIVNFCGDKGQAGYLKTNLRKIK